MAYINYISLVQCHITLFYYAAKQFLSKKEKKTEREKEKKKGKSFQLSSCYSFVLHLQDIHAASVQKEIIYHHVSS